MNKVNTIKNIKRMNPEVNENALNKLNKVNINVTKEKKVDNRVNNTGRPVNKKSSRQIRLAKQALYSKLHNAFVSGKKFKINNAVSDGTYKYVCGDKVNTHGYITSVVGGHVCNVSYVGRTKVKGYTFVLGKKVNVEINLKEVKWCRADIHKDIIS